MRRSLLHALATFALVALAACGADAPDAPVRTQTDKTTTTEAASPTTEATDGMDDEPFVDPAPEATLGITNSATGIAGNVVRLGVEVEGVKIVAADGDMSGKTGHLHVFVDADPVAVGEIIPTKAGVVHAPASPITVAGLTKGKHTLTVVLGDGTHRRIGAKAEASITIDVAGPQVTLEAPATIAAGEPIALSVKAAGFTVVKADGDTSGKSGHFHLFIDPEKPAGVPVEAGAAIAQGDPKILHFATSTLEIPGLEAGQHTLWLVVGDGAHNAMDPLVAATAKITVTPAADK